MDTRGTTGSFGLFGGLIGKDITLRGNSAIHLDSSLQWPGQRDGFFVSLVHGTAEKGPRTNRWFQARICSGPIHLMMVIPLSAARLGLISTLLACLLAGCRQSADEPSALSPLADNSETLFAEGPEPAIAPNTHLAAGRLAESRADWEGAVKQYRSVLQKRPNDAEATFRLGVVLCRLSDREAISVWKRYLSLTNNSSEGWGNLGFCYELLNELPLAEEAYKKGIARDPNNAACRVNYGMYLASRGDYQAAAQQFEHVLPPAQGWYNIGSVCEQKQKPQDAITAYQKALEIDPSMIVAQRRLSILSSKSSAALPEPMTTTNND